MLDAIKKYPEMCRDAVERTNGSNLTNYEFDKIIVCGMGGSAVGGELLRDLMRGQLPIPIEVSKDYHLPKYADEKTLVFCVSYSGDTEETLSQFVDALKIKCKIICLASGGKLKEWCEKLNLPLIVLPGGLQPRAVLPYLFLPMLTYLQNIGLVNVKGDLEESIKVLNGIDLGEMDGIASDLKDSSIAIYGQLPSVTRRFKNQFNENSKMPARYDVFPELDHNEIMGYQNLELNKSTSIIFLRDRDETEEMKARIEITRDLIRDSARNVFEIYSSGNSKLAKILSLVYIGDYLSYRLAVLNGIDPEKVENINKLKKGLKERLNFVERLEKQIENLK
jgi:glucose/mannose-6-phosphate isomerase